MIRPRPTREDLARAPGATIPDVLAPDLRVVFVGINPGLYSAAVGHHFARPGNRFWKALHASGFTDRLLDPFEDHELPSYGLGITNLVERATASADDLAADELRAGAEILQAKLTRLRPAVVTILGLGAYRTAFGRRSAVEGPQLERLGGSTVWLLPNPSGLNSHHQLPDHVERFAALRVAATGEPVRSRRAPLGSGDIGRARPVDRTADETSTQPVAAPSCAPASARPAAQGSVCRRGHEPA